jgi:hypothetical protein
MVQGAALHGHDPVPTSGARRRAVRVRALLVVAAAGTLVVSGCAPQYRATVQAWSLPSGTVSGAQVASRAGLAVGVDALWESDADQNADFAAVAATGAKWTTLDIDWNSIQGDGPDSFRWNRATDRAVLNARAHGLTIVGVAAYAPRWARTGGCASGDEAHCLPRNAADYGRFLLAAAARYGSRSDNPSLRGSITVWQIWNEANHQEFARPRPDLDLYTAMVKSASAGIKAVDPTATVIVGGFAPAPDSPDGTEYEPATFLRGLYARGAQGYFDAVGHHPYAYPFNPLEPQSWNAYTQTIGLHAVMTEHGDGAKKVWGTEVGAPTGSDGTALSESEQGQWVHDYLLGWNTVYRSFTGPLIWLSLRDSGTNPRNRSENMGLMHRNRAPKLGYTAFRMAMLAGV